LRGGFVREVAPSLVRRPDRDRAATMHRRQRGAHAKKRRPHLGPALVVRTSIRAD
jgi:hypothetical protein